MRRDEATSDRGGPLTEGSVNDLENVWRWVREERRRKRELRERRWWQRLIDWLRYR